MCFVLQNPGWWSVPDKYTWNLCNWRCCSISVKGILFIIKQPLYFSLNSEMKPVYNEQIYDRMARVEHVDHARKSAQHCVTALLSAQTHKYIELFIFINYNLVSWISDAIYVIFFNSVRENHLCWWCISIWYHMQLWLSSPFLLESIWIWRKPQESLVAIFRGQW